MTLNEALDILGEDQAFRATLYAMNTLLIEKGIYTTDQFEEMVCEYAANYRAGFAGKSKKPKPTSRETVPAIP